MFLRQRPEGQALLGVDRGLDLSLHFPLPKLVAPELQRVIDAMRDEDDDVVDDVVEDALELLDTPAARAALIAAVIDLRDAGRLEPRLAAVALLDLLSPSRQLLGASLIEAAAVAAGLAATPGGVVVARSLAA